MEFEQENNELEDAKAPDYSEILQNLLDPEKELSVSTYYYLSDMPDEHLAAFKANWLNIDGQRRVVIARNMADIAENNFQVDYSPIAPDFLNDTEDKVRLAGLDMLWDSDKVELIQPIIKIMESDQSTQVRAAAAASLGHYLLMAQWGELSLEVEDPISAALLRQINDATTPLPVRRASLESISSLSLPEIQTYIRDAYESGVPEMELSAVFAMGRSADPMWLPIIQEELESTDNEMRGEAAKAAGIIGDSSLSETLAEIAQEDDDLEVRILAVTALGLIGNDIATNVLAELAEEVEDDALLDAIEEALEEMAMLGMDIDLSILDWQGDEDADGDLPLAE